MHSEQIDKLAAALVKVQASIKPAMKSSANPFFKSKYADLGEVWSACREALTANGIAVVQGGGGDGLMTMLLHQSGQWVAGSFPLSPVKPDPQAIGSAITYLRRYSLAAMVGVVTEDEDDDAEAAMARGNGHASPLPAKAEPAPAPSVPRAPINGSDSDWVAWCKAITGRLKLKGEAARLMELPAFLSDLQALNGFSPKYFAALDDKINVAMDAERTAA